jgi:hypothetical protein
MTPKEKAKELVDKFIELTGTSDEYLYSKQCALIAVDEILKLVSNDLDLYYKDCTYWQKVKTEIQAL